MQKQNTNVFLVTLFRRTGSAASACAVGRARRPLFAVGISKPLWRRAVYRPRSAPAAPEILEWAVCLILRVELKRLVPDSEALRCGKAPLRHAEGFVECFEWRYLFL